MNINSINNIIKEVIKSVESEAYLAAKFKADGVELDEKEAIIAIGATYGYLCDSFIKGEYSSQRDSLLQLAALSIRAIEAIDTTQ